MESPANKLAALDARRVALGMTIDVLARRSGVSPSTVERILSGRYASASFKAIERIAAILGAAVRIEPLADVSAMRLAQARFKADQALGPQTEGPSSEADQLRDTAKRERAIHKLLAGSNRTLWMD